MQINISPSNDSMGKHTAHILIGGEKALPMVSGPHGSNVT